MKRAEVVLVPDAGHALPIEAPEKFNAVLLAFLARHSAAQVG
jgi:pimeloyl-ACP methyl ester carboxylesterase